MALTGLGGLGVGASPQAAMSREEDNNTAPMAVPQEYCFVGALFIGLPILD